MKQIIRKMNLSIITCLMVLVLNVTTTFAWAGLQNFSTIQGFDVELESSLEYQIKISLDGVNFVENFEENELNRQIAKNMGFENIETSTDKEVLDFLKEVELQPLTTKRIGNELGPFVSIHDIRKDDFNYDNVVESQKVKEGYYNFDLYVALDYIGDDPIEDESYHDIYIRNINEMLVGKNKNFKLNKKYTLPSYFEGEELLDVVVNSSSAARISFTKYEVMDKGIINDGAVPTSTIIYQGGTPTPTYENGVYSFGGFMDSLNNLAYLDFNDIHYNFPIKQEVFDEFYDNRVKNGLEDAISIKDTDGVKLKLIDESDKLTSDKMMKINVKMWIEGFDGDCFEVISSMPIGMNLLLSHFNMN